MRCTLLSTIILGRRSLQIYNRAKRLILLNRNYSSGTDMTNIKIPGRALHYVLKIGNRGKNSYFFRDILGMKVLTKYFFLLYFIKKFLVM